MVFESDPEGRTESECRKVAEKLAQDNEQVGNVLCVKFYCGDFYIVTESSDDPEVKFGFSLNRETQEFIPRKIIKDGNNIYFYQLGTNNFDDEIFEMEMPETKVEYPF